MIVGGLSQAAPALSLYFTTAVLAGVVGWGIPLVYVVALGAIILTAWSAGRFAGHFPSAGSMVTLVSNGIGPRTGIWTGLLTQFGYLLIISSVYVLWGLWISELLMRWFGVDIPWQVIMVLGAIVFLGLMIIGIQVSMIATAILFAFEFIVIFVLATVIILQGGAEGNTTQPFTLGPDGMSGLWLGFVFAVFSYVGWEGSLSLAEEARDPRHAMPIAPIFNILVLGGLYVFATYAAVIGFGVSNMEALAADPAPFDTLAQQYTPALRAFVDIAGATSIAASALAATNNMARVLFNMGREGMISRVLGSVHPRFKTPHIALTFYVAFSVIICAVWGLFQDPLGVFGGVAGLGSIAVIPGYMLINISLIVYANRHPAEFPRRWLYTLVPAVGVIVLAFPLYQVTNPVGQSFPFNTFWLVILAVAIIAAVYTQLLVRSKPEIVREAGSILA